MKLQIVTDGAGKRLAAAEVSATDQVAVEPELESGQKLEVIEVPRSDLYDIAAFFSSR